jgi:hypothetical protein
MVAGKIDATTRQRVEHWLTKHTPDDLSQANARPPVFCFSSTTRRQTKILLSSISKLMNNNANLFLTIVGTLSGRPRLKFLICLQARVQVPEKAYRF